MPRVDWVRCCVACVAYVTIVAFLGFLASLVLLALLIGLTRLIHLPIYLLDARPAAPILFPFLCSGLGDAFGRRPVSSDKKEPAGIDERGGAQGRAVRQRVDVKM